MNVSSHSVGFLLSFLDIPFDAPKVLILRLKDLCFFCLLSLIGLVSYLRIQFLIQGYGSLTVHLFPSKSFMVLDI